MPYVTVYTDSFTGSDVNPLPEPWVTITGTADSQRVGNRVRGTTDNGHSRYASDNVFNNMRCTAIGYRNVGTGQVGAGVRCSSTAFTCYLAYFAGLLELASVVGGAFSSLGSSTTGNGDTVGCAAVFTGSASNIFANKNGVQQIGPVSDSAIPPGGTWCFRISEGVDLANTELDDIVLEVEVDGEGPITAPSLNSLGTMMW